MNRVEIDKDRCKACKLCINVCQRKLLELAEELNAKGYHPIAIHSVDKCTACGLCAIMCPEASIEVFKEVKVKKTA
jgi:2-oxoglutarate ferredoxin oxidoreductase subunit delta